MGTLARLSCFLLIACGASTFARASGTWVSSEWTPLVEENARLFQQAEAGFNIAVERERRKIEEAERVQRRPTRKELDAAGVPASESGQTQALGPGAAIPGTRKRGKDAGQWLTLEELLPRSLDFAAPRAGGLILQRTSTSVLFGRTDSDELVVLPLSGAETDIIHGLRASISEANGNLRMLVGLPTGSTVLFEYRQDPASHAMSVHIRVGGGPPGTGVELRRLYRQAQVRVGAPRKSP